MILSFINIRTVPREMLKISGFALGFQHIPRDLTNVNEWKIMFDPYILKNNCLAMCLAISSETLLLPEYYLQHRQVTNFS